MNAHTLTDEELRTALFWVVTQGIVVSCVMTQKSALLTLWPEVTHRWGIVCSKLLCVVFDVELVEMKFGFVCVCVCVCVCVRARVRLRAYVRPRIFALRDEILTVVLMKM